MKYSHKLIKSLSVILILSFSLLLQAGCGNTSASESESTPPPVTDSDAQTSDEPKPNIPDNLDFDSANFTVIYPGNAISMKYSFGEQNGEVMNDTLYERNLVVEEALNVKITPFALDNAYVDTKIEASVFAGDGAYQMALTHSMISVGTMVTGGLLEDWNDISYVDFDKPWWNAAQIEELALDGNCFYASGSLLVPNPVALFFNKGMVKDYNLENPYTLVLDGKWTFDKMMELAKAVSQDVDGNGIYNELDTYGYVGEINWKTTSYMFAAGQKITDRDNDGSVILAMNTERMQTIIEKTNQLYHGGTYSYSINQNHNPLSVMFQNGQALMYLESMVNAEQYRTTDVDFGILPLPKLDEAQENYYALSWTGFMGIPKNVDTELAGAVSELLCYESLMRVNPVYYDTLLASKVARDNESAEMLDIIFDNYVCDMAMSYSLSDPLLYTVNNLLAENSVNFASYYAKNEAAALVSLETLLESIQ